MRKKISQGNGSGIFDYDYEKSPQKIRFKITFFSKTEFTSIYVPWTRTLQFWQHCSQLGKIVFGGITRSGGKQQLKAFGTFIAAIRFCAIGEMMKLGPRRFLGSFFCSTWTLSCSLSHRFNAKEPLWKAHFKTEKLLFQNVMHWVSLQTSMYNKLTGMVNFIGALIESQTSELKV